MSLGSPGLSWAPPAGSAPAAGRTRADSAADTSATDPLDDQEAPEHRAGSKGLAVCGYVLPEGKRHVAVRHRPTFTRRPRLRQA